MSKATEKPASASPVPTEETGVDICPLESVFNCSTEGVVMTGNGHARMYSALHGIETLTALLFQRELDRDNEGGIVIGQNVGIGLLNALGTCAEFAQFVLGGRGGHSRIIGTHQADYPALDRLVNGKP